MYEKVNFLYHYLHNKVDLNCLLKIIVHIFIQFNIPFNPHSAPVWVLFFAKMFVAVPEYVLFPTRTPGPSNNPLSVYSNSIFSSVHSFTHTFFFSSAKHKHIYALNAFNKSVSIWNTPDLVLFSQHHNTHFDPQLLLVIRGQSD